MKGKSTMLDNEKSLDYTRVLPEIYAKMPYKWEKWGKSDKGKDSFDIVESMQKGFYLTD
jgi:hypothetical protein